MSGAATETMIRAELQALGDKSCANEEQRDLWAWFSDVSLIWMVDGAEEERQAAGVPLRVWLIRDMLVRLTDQLSDLAAALDPGIKRDDAEEAVVQARALASRLEMIMALAR